MVMVSDKSDSAASSSTTTTSTANASSVDIYGATGTSSPSNAFGDTYTSPDESMQATIDDTLATAEDGTTGTTTEEATTASIDENSWEYRDSQRNHLDGFGDNSRLSSFDSASTGEETVDGQSDALAQEYPSTKAEALAEHNNELFGDMTYGAKVEYS